MTAEQSSRMRRRRPDRAVSVAPRPRQLLLEALESRQVLSAAAPWHNDLYARDVDQNGFVTPRDFQLLVNRMILTGGGPLTPPAGTPEFLYDVNADNMLSPADLGRVVNRLLTPPEVVLDTLMPFTIDVTPRMKATVSGPVEIPDGTPLHIDVDLDFDGFYTGDEVDYMVTSVHRNQAEFALDPALPYNDASGPYSIKLQARLVDPQGVQGTSAPQSMVVDTQMSDVLANYVAIDDGYFQWAPVFEVEGPGYTYTVLSMTSQIWREGNVSDPVWDHYLRVITPAAVTTDTALLLISGSDNDNPVPDEFDPENEFEDAALVAIAQLTGAITIELLVVPNQPVTFEAEEPPVVRKEDAIIAYTLDQYMRNLGEPGNELWPLLLPMTKSAVRAMDAMQEYALERSEGLFGINDFIVTGFSKRGWTTWLTAAVDDRVRAIAPGVFDNPNQGPQMVHHYQSLGFFSEAVGDYTEMQIFDRFRTPEAQELSKIIDPYRYFQNGRFDDLPILVLNSAGDEFFHSDSSQFYFEDLPGPLNRMRYFPNSGHGLNYGAVESVVLFFDAIVRERPLPDVTWTIETDGSIHAQTDTDPIEVLLWQATDPDARDFRWGEPYGPGGGPIGPPWTSTQLFDENSDLSYVASVPPPEAGATAFLIEFHFPSPIPEVPYVFTTGVRVESYIPWYEWPFDDAPPPAPLVAVDEKSDAPQAAPLVVPEASESELPIFAMPAAEAVDPVPAHRIGSVRAEVNQGPTFPPSALRTIATAPLQAPDAYDPEFVGPLAADADDAAVDSVFDDELDELLL